MFQTRPKKKKSDVELCLEHFACSSNFSASAVCMQSYEQDQFSSHMAVGEILKKKMGHCSRLLCFVFTERLRDLQSASCAGCRCLRLLLFNRNRIHTVKIYYC